MPVYALGDRHPAIDPTAFVHPDAVIIGDVRIGAESSIWPTAVLRGDHGAIIVGSQTSVQDGTVVHCTRDHDTVIGDRCVIGHNAHLEGCTIHDDSLVGSGSIVLHRAQVGPRALVGAGALVGNDKVVPSGARALGIPAVITSDVVSEGDFDDPVAIYVHNAHWYAAELRRLD
jgi:carbonic anhydrase/acetyltransferase-like protein (isoleucine patch superfamily)